MSCIKQNCAKCPNDLNECTDCEPGHSLRLGECKENDCDVENCKVCAQQIYSCSECDPGYSLVRGRCYQECPDESAYCGSKELCDDSNQCQKCPRGMFNIGKGCFCIKDVVCEAGTYCYASKCQMCSTYLQNCVECSNESTCYQCNEGYEVVNERCSQKCGAASCSTNEICVDAKCEKCPGSNVNFAGECKCRATQDVCPAGFYCDSDGCQECSSWMKNCKACTDEYECIENIEPCDDFNCKLCGSYKSNCQTCNPGYRMLASSCLALCGETGLCINWEICDETGHCQHCPYNMRDKAGVCSCHNEICTDGQFCLTEAKKCQQCNLEMPNCKNCSGLTTCAELLIPCAVANCAMCELAAETCSKCASGYKLLDNLCKQQCGNFQCPENEICVDDACKICPLNEINVAGVCSCGFESHCAKGTYCSPESKCVSCPPNCKMCNGATCYVCEPGFFLGDQGCWKRNKSAIIAGSVAGGAIIILLIAGMLFYFLKYHRQREYAMQKAAQATTSEVAQVQQDQMYI